MIKKAFLLLLSLSMMILSSACSSDESPALSNEKALSDILIPESGCTILYHLDSRSKNAQVKEIMVLNGKTAKYYDIKQLSIGECSKMTDEEVLNAARSQVLTEPSSLYEAKERYELASRLSEWAEFYRRSKEQPYTVCIRTDDSGNKTQSEYMYMLSFENSKDYYAYAYEFGEKELNFIVGYYFYPMKNENKSDDKKADSRIFNIYDSYYFALFSADGISNNNIKVRQGNEHDYSFWAVKLPGEGYSVLFDESKGTKLQVDPSESALNEMLGMDKFRNEYDLLR